jgi:hypothetical protein
MFLKIMPLILLAGLFSTNVFAYNLSDLNGSWYAKSFNVSFKLSGLPRGKVKINEPYIAGFKGKGENFFLVGFCEIRQLEKNLFESNCYTNTKNDHSLVRFIDENTIEEEDLLYGFGKIIETRVK